MPDALLNTNISQSKPGYQIDNISNQLILGDINLLPHQFVF
ncbi:MAG: hypothetical protein ACTS8R_01335 [Arsenophonus sp. NC-QC1-MAG3]